MGKDAFESYCSKKLQRTIENPKKQKSLDKEKTRNPANDPKTLKPYYSKILT